MFLSVGVLRVLISKIKFCFFVGDKLYTKSFVGMYLQTFLSGDVGLVIGDLRGLVFFIKTIDAGKTIHKIQKGKSTDF